jgi:hypothetical protein
MNKLIILNEIARKYYAVKEFVRPMQLNIIFLNISFKMRPIAYSQLRNFSNEKKQKLIIVIMSLAMKFTQLTKILNSRMI